MRVAIFDFDGTLYKKETFPVLMNHLKTHPLYRSRYKRFYYSIVAPYVGYKMKLYPERKMKEVLMQRYIDAFKNISTAEIDAYFAEIAQKMISDFHANVVERLNEHIADGDFVMLVSGAYTPLLHAATKQYAFNTIIGTEIPYTNGVIHTKNKLYHIQAERKNEQILKALKGKTIDWEHSYAYADSFSDLCVLELVGNPVVVAPDEKLKTIATSREWEIWD